ncbi:hypothetical protein [Vibrio crassostreae]|uniref:hypothetical protein n=1 Tax=Vibrio crassostreae TaxID=246167 RepID=UPI001B308B4A|nr:hypothetical protein [Vibrio crassostreae]
MERLSITTHLIAVLTAFSAFTMPIALEVINRVKSRYRSAYYMDSLEEIMGFRIRSLFGQLILMLISLLLFSLIVSAFSDEQFPAKYVLPVELLFFIFTSVLLVKEFHFIKTIFLATRSDELVTNYLIDKIETGADKEAHYGKEVDLLVQIGCYNIEHTETPLGEKSIDKRLFDFIESAYKSESKHVNIGTIEDLLIGLASMLTAVRNVNNREKYVYLQREYGKHLIHFYDHQKDGDERFSRIMEKLYEESINELYSDHYWLLKADFLISVRTWDITNPYTLRIIDRHIRNLIDFLARKKPGLIVDVLDNYRNFNNFDSYLDSNIYNLSDLGGEYSPLYFDDIHNFTKKHDELLMTNPQEYAGELMLLIDKVIQEKRERLKASPEKYQQLIKDSAEFEKEIMHELIKKIGNHYSERSAQEAIRTLALYTEWHSILDCYNSISPASSRIIRVGHKLLTENINNYIDELGKSEYVGMFEREGLNHAYLKAVPILIMLSLYNWRQRNLNASIEDAVKGLVASLNLQERTISKAKAIEADMKKVIYYAGSSNYSKSFCSYFGIEHEQEAFKGASIKLLQEIESFAKNEQDTLKRTQPLSDAIKLRFEEELKDDASRLIKDYPLFHNYQVTHLKQTNFQRFIVEDARDAFLDNTGVHHSFNGLSRVGFIHSQLAFTLISTKGNTIPSLQLSKLSPSEILFITPKDWEAATSTLDLSKIGIINKNFVFTEEPLHKFYIHDTNNPQSYVTLYNPESKEEKATAEQVYADSLEIEFIDEENKVTVNLDYHIYLN